MVQHGIMFHGFHGGPHVPDGSGTVSAEDLERVIVRVGRNCILSPEDWIRKSSKGCLPAEAVCLTFDDGLKSQIDIALPVLQAYDLQAFWFVNSAPLEGKIQKLDVFRRFRFRCFSSVDEYYSLFFQSMSLDFNSKFNSSNFHEFSQKYQKLFPFYTTNDIKYRYIRDSILQRNDYESLVLKIISDRGESMESLSADLWLNESDIKSLVSLNHEIGLHSFDHPTNLESLTYEEQYEQYHRNYEGLRKIAGRISSAAHPCGSYSIQTLEILRQLGVTLAFNSTMSKKVTSSEYWINQLQMGREDVASIK